MRHAKNLSTTLDPRTLLCRLRLLRQGANVLHSGVILRLRIQAEQRPKVSIRARNERPETGGPGRSRTCDQLLRRQLL